MMGTKERKASVAEYDDSARAWHRKPERILSEHTEITKAVEMMKESSTIVKVSSPRRPCGPWNSIISERAWKPMIPLCFRWITRKCSIPPWESYFSTPATP